MVELAVDSLPATARSARVGQPLSALSQRRQRPRRAEELDVAAPTLGLWPLGRAAGGPPDPRRVPRTLGAPAYLLLALDETAREMAGRQPLGASPRCTADRLPTAPSQPSDW